MGVQLVKGFGVVPSVSLQFILHFSDLLVFPMWFTIHMQLLQDSDWSQFLGKPRGISSRVLTDVYHVLLLLLTHLALLLTLCTVFFSAGLHIMPYGLTQALTPEGMSP